MNINGVVHLVFAFEGIKVLDLTRLLPGPYCTMFLADLGAEVIKIEEPRQGDYVRVASPYLHEIVNRNKKSICLNLKSVEGREVFKQLAQGADVIIESFRPGVVEKLEVDYKTIKKVKENIIYCSISGYGQSGPYSSIPGHDINYISIGGLLNNNGKVGSEPIIPGTQVADLGAGGMMAVIGILSGLVTRQAHGFGQHIDVSMLDGVISWLTPIVADLFSENGVPARGKSKLTGGLACYQVYQTKDDKYISIGNLEEKFWENFCNKIGRSDLIGRLNDPPEKQSELIRILTDIFKTKTRKEWEKQLFSKDICFAPVLGLEETVTDPQVAHRQMFFEVPHPKLGTVKQVGFPIKLSQTPGKFRHSAPSLGEHTELVLTKLGFDSNKISKLKENNII